MKEQCNDKLYMYNVVQNLCIPVKLCSMLTAARQYED